MDLSRFTDMLGSPQTVGIDFGSSHFKIVELVRQKESFRLQACGMAEAGFTEDEEGAIRRVRVFLREHGIKIAKAVVNITDPTLRIRRMELAKMPDRDLKTAIRWNFREQVDVPLEKYVVSYTTVPGTAQEERLPLMAYGVAADAVTRCQTRCRKLGVRATAVEPNATALLAAFDYNMPWESGARIALVDFGFHETIFLVMGDGVLFFSRPLTGVTGERLLRILSREGSVPLDEVRAALKNAMAGNEIPSEIAAGLEEFYTQMLVEIQRSIDGYTSLYRAEEGVRKLYVCGGGCTLPNLANHLSKNLGVPTEPFNPFTNIADAQGVKPAPVEHSAMYAVAVGLALPSRRKGKEDEHGPTR